MYLQFVLEVFKRMLSHDHFHWPIGAQHQQRRCFLAPRHEAEPLERRIVAPMQVFEPEDKRFFDADCLDGICQLSQHSRMSDTQCFALQSRKISSTEKCRK